MTLFTELLGALLGLGTSVVRSLEVCREHMTKSGCQDMPPVLEAVLRDISNGYLLSEALRRCSYFPDAYCKYIELTENSGELDTALLSIIGD